MLPLLFSAVLAAADIESKVTHGYADSNGVKIHYASLGQGPLIVMIHGFPDFWYTWRDQMEALSDKFQCVAIDQRGYNLSDKPKGVENYGMSLLAGDVIAVIHALGNEKAIIVGHDWGGVVAWQVALNAPQVTEKLIILNLPHPRGLLRELANNPAQQKASAYARKFQKPEATPTRSSSHSARKIPTCVRNISKPSGVPISRRCSTTTSAIIPRAVHGR